MGLFYFDGIEKNHRRHMAQEGCLVGEVYPNADEPAITDKYTNI